jgi:hypothetical protein
MLHLRLLIEGQVCHPEVYILINQSSVLWVLTTNMIGIMNASAMNIENIMVDTVKRPDL